MKLMQEEHTDSKLQKAISVYKIIKSIDKGTSYSTIMSRIHGNELRNRRIKFARNCAAVLIPLILTGGLWLYFDNRHNDISAIHLISDNVVLSLSDGAEIILNGGQSVADIADYDDVTIRSTAANGVEYIRKGVKNGQASAVSYSTLTIPKGNRHDITLEDGTRIWLNAGSKLRFPNVFGESERRVYLEGEAYFAVTSDSARPFVVETEEQTLKVLGTEFNIYSYPHENGVYTTLVKGSVSLQSKSNENIVLLKPGEQALLENDAEQFHIITINTDDVSAWRKGIIVLEGKTLREVFMQLSRWYDMDYAFQDEEAANLIFRGNLKIFDDIGIIFDIIESLGHIELKVKDNMVTISSKH